MNGPFISKFEMKGPFITRPKPATASQTAPANG
jgi:hypothetical protein